MKIGLNHFAQTSFTYFSELVGAGLYMVLDEHFAGLQGLQVLAGLYPVHKLRNPLVAFRLIAKKGAELHHGRDGVC